MFVAIHQHHLIRWWMAVKSRGTVLVVTHQHWPWGIGKHLNRELVIPIPWIPEGFQGAGIALEITPWGLGNRLNTAT